MVGYAPLKTDLSSDFQNSLQKILSKGSFNESMKLPKAPNPKVANIAVGLPGAPNVPLPQGQGGAFSGGGDLDRLMRAIRGQESGGRYDATNPSGASGAYQILRSNFEGNGGWDREALGKDISYQQFISSPQIQDQIARYKLGQYLSKWGMAGAAATWYGGDWGRKNMHSKVPQNGYPSMYEYIQAILRRAG